MDGGHTFSVRAIDGAGNVDATPATYAWVQDSIAPDTTIDTRPDNPTNSIAASVTFHGTDVGVGVVSFQCALDGAAYTACTSPASYSGSGAAPIRSRAASTRPGTSIHRPLRSPGRWMPAPDTIIDTRPDSRRTAQPPSFHGTDVGLGVAGLGARSTARRRGAPVNYTGLSGGSHTFAVLAFDVTGDRSIVSDVGWTVTVASAAMELNRRAAGAPAFAAENRKVARAFSCSRRASSSPGRTRR